LKIPKKLTTFFHSKQLEEVESSHEFERETTTLTGSIIERLTLARQQC